MDAGTRARGCCLVSDYQTPWKIQPGEQSGTSSLANREAGEGDSSWRDLQPVENVVNRQNATIFLNYLIALGKNTANLCHFEPSQYDIIDI